MLIGFGPSKIRVNMLSFISFCFFQVSSSDSEISVVRQGISIETRRQYVSMETQTDFVNNTGARISSDQTSVETQTE